MQLELTGIEAVTPQVDLLDEYFTAEALQEVNLQMQELMQYGERMSLVLDNAIQVQHILKQGPLTQATFEFLNLDGELNKIVGHELVWNADTQTELQASCLVSIEGFVSAAWEKFVAFLKWCKDKIVKLYKLVFNRSKRNIASAKEIQKEIKVVEFDSTKEILSVDFDTLQKCISGYRKIATEMTTTTTTALSDRAYDPILKRIEEIKSTIEKNTRSATVEHLGYSQSKVSELMTFVIEDTGTVGRLENLQALLSNDKASFWKLNENETDSGRRATIAVRMKEIREHMMCISALTFLSEHLHSLCMRPTAAMNK